MKALQDVNFGRIYAHDLISALGKMDIQPEVIIEFNKGEFVVVLEGCTIPFNTVYENRYEISEILTKLNSDIDNVSIIEDHSYTLVIIYCLNKTITWTFAETKPIELVHDLLK